MPTVRSKWGAVQTLNDDYGSGVEQVVFADGTTWTKAQIRVMLLAQASTNGDDTITGFDVSDTISGGLGNDTINAAEGNDVITGGKGNDTLNGGAGADTYIYARGDGNDTITEGNWNGTNDQLVFTDINPTDVTVRFTGADLLVTIAESAPGAGDAGSVLIKNTLGALYEQGVERITFADGTMWDAAQIRAKAIASAQTTGNDTITGFATGDTYTGGKGNDVIDGGAGNDTYIYARGDGNDTITEGNWGSTNDQLVFSDINPADVTLTRNGTDLTIVIAESAPGAGDGGSILIKDTLDGTYERGIEKIVFANGTVWTRANMISKIAYIAGSSGNDTIIGTDNSDSQILAGVGNDILKGLTGSDTYIYLSGDGNDTIDDKSGSTTDVDVLRLTDLNIGDLTFSRAGSHAKITVNSTGHVITLDEQFYSDTANWGIEKIEFADGTIWDRAQIKAAAISRINGTSGNDTLAGTALNDVFNGGLGDDRFNSGAGSDTYIYASGDGNDYIDDESGSTTDIDVLKLTDLNVADLTFSRSGSHAKITVNSTGHVITLDEQFYSDTANWGIEKIEFADGTVWDRAQIKAAAISRINGTSGDDRLNGTAQDDLFNGGLGNDSLNGGSGDDTYIYVAGDGNDTITEGNSNGFDTLQFKDLNAPDVTLSQSLSNVRDVVVTVNATGETITLVNSYRENGAGNNEGVQAIKFADGTVWDQNAMRAHAILRETSANDTIIGDDYYGERIEGGAGNDTITTKDGDDVIIFKPNFGMDNITDFQAGAGSADVLEFDSGLFADFEAVLAAAAQVGSDTVITYDASNAITLKNVALTSLHEDDVRFLA